MKGLVHVDFMWSHMHCVDRHRFDADPDPTFHFDADPDPDTRNWILPQVLYTCCHIEKSDFYKTFVHSNGSLLVLSYHQRPRCNNFQNVGPYIEIFWEEI
jgi:hypothetical protein